ncbi:MAG: 2Fe-2S iron-sulfur cluster binding domain-containing protein [Desulfobacter sp.]|nr:2Fe-2S iron-sulfur cluster binding domain-containing protein [Desulfobacter sp.]WDP83859.1 MAG: 2Fe-2S iron-sulfur cluster binding domain-containing protein [Desulfobacter sp.]
MQLKIRLQCTINAEAYDMDIAPDTLLIDLLRSLGFSSLKQGCDTANCGLCTVWMNKVPVLAGNVQNSVSRFRFPDLPQRQRK